MLIAPVALLSMLGMSDSILIVLFFAIMFLIYFGIGALFGRIIQQYVIKDKKKRKWKNIPMWIRTVFIIYIVTLILQFIVWAGFGFQSAGP